MISFKNKNIKNIFNAYPLVIRNKLLDIRQLIFNVALENEEIGEINEILKWQQPSYLTLNPKSGTTIRLAFVEPSKLGIYVHCQTTLIAEFKEVYPEMDYAENRAILFNYEKKLPSKVIKHFIYLALTYHYRKKRNIGI